MTKPNLQKRYQAKKQNVLLLFFPFLFNLSKRCCFCSAHLWSFLVFSPPAHSHPGAGQRLRSALQTLGLSRACPPLHPSSTPPDFKKDVALAGHCRAPPQTGADTRASLPRGVWCPQAQPTRILRLYFLLGWVGGKCVLQAFRPEP